jgi:MFS family permease
MGEMTPTRTREATFGAVVGVAEFRVLWIAATQSELGDQLARVALSLLVFDATASAALTALTYALTFLPPLVTGPLLAGLADRFPRRTVMVVTDSACAILVALMAVPNVPLLVMLALLTIMVALRPLFAAARTATVPQLLGQERTVVGLGLLNMTQQSAQVLGFACGGAMVGWIGARPALALDAATFLIGAVLARLGLRHRLAAHEKRSHGMRAGVRLVWTDRRLRHLVLLAWLYGFFVVPEGLAAPYANQLGAGPVAVGVLLAAGPLGSAAGALIFTRWIPPALQPRLIGPLAILSGVPLALLAAHPSLSIVLLFLALSGAFTTYVVLALGSFLGLVPDTHRGQALGLSNSGLQAAQGLGIVLAGTLAERVPPSLAIATCGLLGSVGSAFASNAWRRAQHENLP